MTSNGFVQKEAQKEITMEVKRELSFDDLDHFFWAGARDRWNDATDDQKERVWERLNEWFSDEIPSETDINDAVWFECDDIFDEDEEDEMDESIRRRRNLRRVIESRRSRTKKYNEVMYFDKEGNYLFGKAEMQKRAEELARVLFSKDIDVKDLDVFTVDSGTESYINIKEHTPSKYKFRTEVGIISLKHKDNEVTVSGSDHVDRIKLEDDLNTSDTVEIADMIKSSPEFDLIVKEYNNSLSNKKESLRRRITRR